MNMQVQIVKMHAAAIVPKYATDFAAGLDLHSTEARNIYPGSVAKIGTGLKIAIPRGYVGLVCPRSGLAFKENVTVANAPGIIDADYRGEICVLLANRNPTRRFDVFVGDRIAQLVLVPVAQAQFIEVAELDETVRGEGGFGSTGKS